MADRLTSLSDKRALADGMQIPCIGFGTWQSADGAECYTAVKSALEAGYRHIDTAAGYGNEESVGCAVRDYLAESGIRRSSLFITTKLWNDDHGYEAAKNGFTASLKKLGLEYVDLYLIHWPRPAKFHDNYIQMNAESWRAMEEFAADGKIRSLGVSNFLPHHIEELMQTAKRPPVVNQIKLCPGQTQDETVAYCRAHQIVLEGYSPMGTGAIFANAAMQALAEKYQRSIAQLCIRWSVQNGFIPLPKSVTPERIAENAKVFDFTIDEDDCRTIATLHNSGIKPARNSDDIPF